MDLSAETDKIISEAHQWTFQGDCSLLDLMKRISENLQQRASHTTEALQELSTNVKRTKISLDNVANSLTALQFGQQFVESRCQDDDETIANVTDVPIVESTEDVKSSAEIMKTFLQNNLSMLRNCHEKYSIDLHDSEDDEDDDATTNNKTSIYVLKNPYNEQPLPYIYGTKQWKENWHVGLHETENDYSGDEVSEAFSESSSSSSSSLHRNDDNIESYESNSANLSDWASNTSLRNEKFPSIQNAASLHGSQPLFPHDLPSVTPAAMALTSDTTSSSTTRANVATKPRNIQYTTRPHEHDLFAALRQTPPSDNISSSSPSSSISAAPFTNQMPQTLFTTTITSAAQSSLGSSENGKSGINTAYQTQSNLFEVPPAAPPELIKDKPAGVSQIKRKPVNLFDDDEFNSFMSEIVDKAQTKAETSPKINVSEANISAPTPKARSHIPAAVKQTVGNHSGAPFENRTSSSSTQVAQTQAPTTFKELPKKTINLFDDSPPHSPTVIHKKQPMPTPSPPQQQQPINTNNKTSIKSLFDDDFDDDDDDDFLNLFGKTSKNSSKTLGTTSIFEAQQKSVDIQAPTATKSVAKISLFDDDDDDVGVGVVVNRAAKQTNVDKKNSDILIHKKDGNQVTNKPNIIDDSVAATTSVKSKTKSIFQDVDESDDLFGTQQQPWKKQSETKTISKISIFDDIEDDADDIFGNKQNTLINKTATNSIENVQTNIKPTNVSNTANIAQPQLFAADSDNDSVNNKENRNKILTHEEKNVVNEATKLIKEQDNQRSITNDDHKEIVEDNINANQNDNANTQLEQKLSNANNKFVEQNVVAASQQHFMSMEQGTDARSYNRSISPTIVEAGSNDIRNNVAETVAEAEVLLPAKPVVQNIFENVLNEECRATFDEKSTRDIEHISVDSTNSCLSTDNSNEIIKTNMKQLLLDNESSENIANDQMINKQTLTAIETIEKIIDEQHMPHENADKIANLTMNAKTNIGQNYASLFLDEPPDDSEFFQTLATQNLGASKMFDLETDFDEPALPQTPAVTTALTAAAAAAAGSSNNATITTTAKTKVIETSTARDYSGFSLFSDIPPDDDDDDDNNEDSIVRSNANVATNETNSTKRLHSIFYDDFNETIVATKQLNELAKQTIQTVFNDEPPPDEDAIVAQDVVDRSAAAANLITENVDGGGNDGVAQQTAQKRNKLVIPQMNINVQALLPNNSGARPKIRKTETPEQSPTMEVTNATKQNSIQKPEPSSNDNILISVCKTRVRAPANRRPSTRSARQQNYLTAKLQADAEQLADERNQVVENVETVTNNNISEQKNNVAKANVQINTKTVPNKTLSFLDSIADDDDNDFLFNTTPKVISSSLSASVHDEPTEEFEKPTNQKSTILKTVDKSVKTNKLFLDSEDDEDVDDLFGPKKKLLQPKLTIAAATPVEPAHEFRDSQQVTNNNNNTTTTTTSSNNNKKTQSSIFDSDEDNDNNVDDFLSSLKQQQQQPPPHKQIDAGKSIFSDIESDDDDDLFGGKVGGVVKKQNKNRTETKQTQQQQPTNNKSIKTKPKPQPQPPATTTHLITDNPLADLL